MATEATESGNPEEYHAFDRIVEAYMRGEHVSGAEHPYFDAEPE